MATRMQQRRATLAEWTADDEVLAPGEIGVILEPGGDHFFRIGDGVRPFSQLPTHVGPKGGKGDPGARGSIIYSGSAVPAGSLGVVGDFYIRNGATNPGDTYEKTGTSTWTLTGNIRGAVGPAGPAPALPHARFKRNSSQSGIVTATSTPVQFSAKGAGDEINTVGDRFDLVGATLNRVIVNDAGLYLIEGALAWSSNSTGVRRVQIMRVTDGVAVASDVRNAAGGADFTYQEARCVIWVAANDDFRLEAYHTAGTDQILRSENNMPRLTFTRLTL